VRGLPVALAGAENRARRAALTVALVASFVIAATAAATVTPVPTPIGVGARFHPAASSSSVLHGQTVAGFRCRTGGRRAGVHLELFARGRVVIVPAGIGVAVPFVREGAFVRPRGCSYAVRTLEPTGVLEVRPGWKLTLGSAFAVWGQRLSRTTLAGFMTGPAVPVRAYVGGRRWRGRVEDIPLTRHGEIVLELGPYIRPHRSFLFPRGL